MFDLKFVALHPATSESSRPLLHRSFCLLILATSLLNVSKGTAQQSRALGLDVSAWQGNITQNTWNNIRTNENRQFVFIRSSRGGTTGYYNQNDADNSDGLNTLSQRYDDPYFVQNVNRATSAGLLVGSYHFSRPDIITSTPNSGGIANSGADEADHFIQMAGAWMRPGFLLPVHDLEAGQAERSSSDLSQFGVAFSDRVYQVMGIRPLVYVSQSYANYVNATIPQVHPEFWIARYANQADPESIDVQHGHPPPSPATANVYGKWNSNHTVAIPYPDGHPWSFWQYASTVRLQSFNNGGSNLDGNVAQGGTEFVKDFLVPAIWTHDVSGQWTTLTNWNSGLPPIAPVSGTGQVAPVGTQTLPAPRLPTVNDTVILDRPNANIVVTLASGTQNIRKLYAREELNITGGTLNIDYVPSWDSTPFSAQFSAPVSVSGGAAVKVHALQVDTGRTFTVGGSSTLRFSKISLLPGATSATLAIGGTVNFAALSNGTNTIANGSGSGSSGKLDLTGNNRTLGIATGSDLSIDVPIQNGAITKIGSGTLRLTSPNTYNAGTTISAGTLIANNSSGSATGNGTVNVDGGTLGGNGTIAGFVLVESNGTIAPGTADAVGILNVGGLSWAGNGTYQWNVKDVSTGQGSGWDKIMINGPLDISATSGNRFKIDLTSLTPSDIRGIVHNFSSAQYYSWIIAEATGGISNFAAEKFQVLTSSFDDNLGNGVFSISQNGNTIRLNFEPSGPPLISLQPQSQSVALNSNVTFSVTASGSLPLSYQWRFAGTNILLASGSSYTRPNVQLTDAGGYSVAVSNNMGSVTSSVATLTVVVPPSIDSHPSNRTNLAGTTATFSVAASGTTPAYRWRKNGTDLLNGVNVSGATADMLTLSSVSALDQGEYSVIVSNVAGSVTSAIATLTVAEPPSIQTNPKSQTQSQGEDATFTVVASGFQPLSFQWLLNGAPIPGGTASSYTRTEVQASDSGNYSVTVSNSVGTVTSSNGILVVVPTGGYAYITNIWNIRAGSRPYVTTGNTERGIAINPFTGHVLLASRSAQLPAALGILILDAETGLEVGAMNVAEVNNAGTFKLNKIGVAEDGAIYGANLTTTSATSDLVIYRWADELSSPTIAFSGKPDAGVTARWGDSFAIQGAGTNTRIMISGSSSTTNIALFTTSDGVSFQVAKVTTTPPVGNGEFAQGITFGSSNHFFSKHATHSSNVVKQFLLDPTANTATQTATIPMDNHAIALRLLEHQQMLCTVFDDNSTTNAGHQLRLYDVGNISAPVLISNFFFLPIENGTNSFNSNRAGHVDTDGVRIVALDTQNGVVALKLIFGEPPAITDHPDTQTVSPGQNVQFTASATGDGPLIFSWRKNGTDLTDDARITGAHSTVLTINNASAADAGDYSLFVSNRFGIAISEPASLAVTSVPIILTHPTNLLMKVGTNATFNVSATGPDLRYQWFFAATPIPDATNASYTRSNLQLSHGGNYAVVVSNSFGATLSSNALLTVSTDQTAPTLTLTYPASKQRLTETVDVTNGLLVVRGTTSDNVGTKRVEYQFNGGAWLPATGTTLWSATVTLIPGPNSITVRAIDAVNNISAPIVRTFTYVRHALLSVQVTGGGVLSPNLNNQSLELAKSYRMTAAPLTADWIFTNWTQIAAQTTNIISSNAVLDFIMESNLVMSANFITNPFVRAAGLYHGLFYPSNAVAHDRAGFFVMKVTAKLGYSVKLLFDGNAVAFSGKLSLPGTVSREIPRTRFGKSPLNVAIQLNFADQVTGEVAASNWTAQLSGDRWIWTTNTLGQQALAYTNLYTMALPGLDDPAQGPPGASYGLVKVDKIGKIRMSGRSADNQVIRQSTKISKTGEWPFYSPMYVEKRAVNINGVMKTNKEFQGSMLGWIHLATNHPAGKTNMAPIGDVSWIKTGWTNTLYTAGFTNVGTTLGSRYLVPAAGVRSLNLTNAQLDLSEGNMVPVNSAVTVQSNNTVTAQATTLHLLRGTFSRGNGQFLGVFSHPGLENAPTKFYGVALPDHNRALGYFLGTNQSGKMVLKP